MVEGFRTTGQPTNGRSAAAHNHGCLSFVVNDYGQCNRTLYGNDEECSSRKEEVKKVKELMKEERIDDFLITVAERGRLPR